MAMPATVIRTILPMVVPVRPGSVPQEKIARGAATPGTAVNREGETVGDTQRTFHLQTGSQWLQVSS